MKVRLMAGQVEYLPMGQAKSKSRYCNDKKGNLRSRYCVSLNDQRVHISCQDVKFARIKDMKRRSKHFGGVADFTSIADI